MSKSKREIVASLTGPEWAIVVQLAETGFEQHRECAVKEDGGYPISSEKAAKLTEETTAIRNLKNQVRS